MKMNPLGRTGLMVSELCLGTMTFGNQTPPAEAHRQIDRALEAGINFMDTAEMYPVNPVRAETYGRTEEVIGDWNAASGRRSDWILATKHSGEGSLARDGAPITSKTIRETLEGSLKRLKTDYIDLYQFHWPNRGSYMFRQNWRFDPSVSPRVFEAVEAYLGVAREFGLDPVHMALAWSARRPFVASSIFGATTMDQLDHLLGASELVLSDDLLARLDEVHKAHPMPY